MSRGLRGSEYACDNCCMLLAELNKRNWIVYGITELDCLRNYGIILFTELRKCIVYGITELYCLRNYGSVLFTVLRNYIVYGITVKRKRRCVTPC